MASFKKFWFVTNWGNKKPSANRPDSIVSTNTSSRRLPTAVSPPQTTAGAEQIAEPRLSTHATVVEALARRPNIRSGSKKPKASSARKRVAPASALKKSSGKPKKAAAKRPPKTAHPKFAGKKARSTGKDQPPAVWEASSTAADGEKDETDAAADKDSEIVSGLNNATIREPGATVAANNPEGGDVELPPEGDEKTDGKIADGAGEVRKDHNKPHPDRAGRAGAGRAAVDAADPVLGEASTPGGSRARRRREGPAGGEEASPAVSRSEGRPGRGFEEATPSARTPFTIVGSFASPGSQFEPRKPFSQPLTFATARSVKFDRMNDVERQQSAMHERQLQRAWTLVDAPLRKTLPTPLSQPSYLRDPPEFGSAGTVTSELRRQYAQKRMEAARRSSLELIKDPTTLGVVQPRINKCEMLRTKHAKKEPIVSTFFEQHYDRFHKPPFRSVSLMRKCI